MRTKTVYICDHCYGEFDDPCEEHEAECLETKKAAARFELLSNIILGERFVAPVGAKINGTVFLLPDKLNVKTVKLISSATELISTAKKPSVRDADLIQQSNEILSS